MKIARALGCVCLVGCSTSFSGLSIGRPVQGEDAAPVTELGVDARAADLGPVDAAQADAANDLGPEDAAPSDVASGPCQPGQSYCTEANPHCVSLDSDPAHCGRCGNRCCPGAVCTGGACVLACGAGMVRCPADSSLCDVCVDPMSDRAHCGACGRRCEAARLCVMGQCVGACTVVSEPSPDPGQCDGRGQTTCLNWAARNAGGDAAAIAVCQPRRCARADSCGGALCFCGEGPECGVNEVCVRGANGARCVCALR